MPITIQTVRKMERTSLLVYGTIMRVRTFKQIEVACTAESKRHGRALKLEERELIRRIMLEQCDTETVLRSIRYGDYGHFREWYAYSCLQAKYGRGRVRSGPEETVSSGVN